MNATNHFNKIIEFIREHRGDYQIEFTRGTTLERDLKITGDDAYDFLIAFCEKFEISISEFDFSKHFAQEGSWGLFKLVFIGKKTGKLQITLADLEKAIATKILPS